MVATTQNVEKREGFGQVCVWPNTTLGVYTPHDFENYMKSEFGVEVQFLEVIETKPDLTKTGRKVKGTGGRPDLFFAVNDRDVGKFAIPRLQVGIRWLEDVLAPGNYTTPIYPERVREYQTWAIEETPDEE